MPAEPIPIASHQEQQQQAGLSASHPIFGRWAAFSPAKSQGTGVSPPSKPSSTATFDDEDDIGDLRANTWAHAAAQRGQRRAASLSLSQGSSLLGSQLGSSSVGSPPSGGALSDKMALGQGVLRRLSFSNGFGSGTSGRPSVNTHVPPPVPSPPNSTPIGSLKPQDGLAAHPPPPAADPGVNRAGTIAGSRRRFSESTARRRGVSPMGERLLRDQVHF